MTRLERSMLGLYGGAWLSLLAVCALCLWQGRALPLLWNADGYGAWLYLTLWAAFGLTLAALARADQAWRVMLMATAANLALNTGLLAWNSGVSAGAMIASLMVLGLLSLPLVPLMHASRIRKPRVKRQRTAARKTMPRRDLQLGWWTWTLALLCSFGSAWKGDDAALRGAASAMLLLVFLVALPALCAGAWRPRRAALGLGLSGLACAALYQPSVWLAICIAALFVGAAGFVMPPHAVSRLWRQRTC